MSDTPIVLREILEGLAEHDVQYLLFGAVGAVFYGYVRNTEDVDIVVAPDAPNIDRVADWLVSIEARLKLNPARAFGARERWGMHKGQNATVLTQLGQIDVVQSLAGLPSWSELVSDAEVYDLDGLRVQVMSRRTLIELKRRRATKLDLADIEAIELLDEL